MAHLSANAVKQIESIIARYENENTPLMMILSDIQREYGYIPLEVQELISEKLCTSTKELKLFEFECFIKLQNLFIISESVLLSLTLYSSLSISTMT